MNLKVLADLIGQMIIQVFGHPYLAGASIFAIIFAILYKHNVPADAAVVIAVPLMIVFAGVFLPIWLTSFIIIGAGIIISLMFIKIVNWV